MNKKTNDIADCEELWDNIVSERDKLLMTCMAEEKYLNRTKFDLGQWISRKWL